MTTIERLSRILEKRYKLDPSRLTPDQPLGALGIDSLGMVEMLFFIEEEFDVQFPSEGVTFGTLGEATKYVDDLIARQKGPRQSTADPSGRGQRNASTDPGS